MIDDIFGSYTLDARPSSDFNYEAARKRLINLQMCDDLASDFVLTTPGDDLVGDIGHEQNDGTGRHGQLMKLAGLIDLESKLSVRPQICSKSKLNKMQGRVRRSYTWVSVEMERS